MSIPASATNAAPTNKHEANGWRPCNAKAKAARSPGPVSWGTRAFPTPGFYPLYNPALSTPTDWGLTGNESRATNKNAADSEGLAALDWISKSSGVDPHMPLAGLMVKLFETRGAGK
jgi:hypothetical protein